MFHNFCVTFVVRHSVSNVSYCVCQFHAVAYILCFLSNIWSYCGCPFYVIGYAARFVNFLPACRTNHRLTDGLITDQTQIKQLLKPENSSSLFQTEWCNVPSWFGVIIKHVFTLCSHLLCSTSKLLLMSHTNCQLFTKKYWGLADATISKRKLYSCLWQS